jgi:glycosyltransferase involved in cell wall biosynthesis
MVDGAIDGTLEILQKLQASGFSITILEKTYVHFNEAKRCTKLYHLAVEAQADWIFFLDADEFIDERKLGSGLRNYLVDISKERMALSCIKVRLADYLPTSKDIPETLIVPQRLLYRRPISDNLKVLVKNNLVSRAVEIQPGSHDVYIDNGIVCPWHEEKDLILAHYPERSIYQFLAKAVIGWGKVLAAGEEAISKRRSRHYEGPFMALLENPSRILRGAEWTNFRHENENLVFDPVTYLGGDLQFSQPVDYQMAAIQMVVSYLFQITSQYGLINDKREAVRLLVEEWSSMLE